MSQKRKYQIGGASASTQAATVTNQHRKDWNSYVGWLKQQGLSGSPELDKNNLGYQKFDEFVKTNPNTSLNRELLPNIRKEMLNYRQWVLDQAQKSKAQIPGVSSPEQFMRKTILNEQTKNPDYPGQNLTFLPFPEQYLTTFENNVNVGTEKKGFSTIGSSQRQNGGFINETGYLDGEETSNNPFNIIPSNSITMEGVTGNVIGVPIKKGKLGKPVLMQEGGNYHFKGADGVLEYRHKPKFQVGGGKTPSYEEWLQQTGQDPIQGSEGYLQQQYQQYVNSLPKASPDDAKSQPFKNPIATNNLMWGEAPSIDGKPEQKISGLPFQKPEDVIDISKQTGYDENKRPISDLGDKTVPKKKGDEQLEYSDGFKTLNAAMDMTQLIAGKVNDIKTNREEKDKLAKARYQTAQPSTSENGLNNIPIVYKKGGLTPNKAREILHHKSVHGHPLTDAQRRFFGAKSEGNTKHYQEGGATEEVEGLNKNTGAELEKGEVFQQQDGNIKKVAESEPTHENGGSNQPFVFRVLEDTADKRGDIDSKLLKVSPEDAMEMVGIKIKKPLTHSKLYEEATKFYAKQLTKYEKGLQDSMDYAKLSKDKYGSASIDENQKNLQNVPTDGMLFDAIFNHQEGVKSKYGIMNGDENKYGGHVYQKGGAEKLYKMEDGQMYTAKEIKDTYEWTDADIQANLKNGIIHNVDPTKIGNTAPMYRMKDGQLYTADELKSTYEWTDEDIKASSKNGVVKVVNEPVYKLKDGQYYTAKELGTTYGWTANDLSHQVSKGYASIINNAADGTASKRGTNVSNQGKFKMKVTPGVAAGDTTPAAGQNTNTANTNPTSAQSNSGIAKGNTPSRFNEPLRPEDVAGDVMGLLANSSRYQVPLEQIDAKQLRYREQSPLPTIEQGQEDYNSMLGLIPQNQVGMGNMANLFAKKYSLNAQTFGQYENINKAGAANVDAQNAANQQQMDITNANLRDQMSQRVLQGKEVQQENKLKLFNDLFTKIALNRKLNREGNLVMQMSPYFNQYGEYNGNQYNVAPSAGSSDPKFKYTINPKTGRKVAVPA